MRLYAEFAVAAMGEDCGAAQAWVNQMVADNLAAGAADALAARRAAAHWDQCSEAMQMAIADKLGFGGGSSLERWPVPPAIAEDYKTAFEFITQAIS